MKRHGAGGFAPEVAPLDLEGAPRKVNMGGGGAQMPFQNWNRQTSGNKGHGDKSDQGMKNILMIAGGIWVGGYLLMGYHILWPLYLVLDLLEYVFEIPLLGSILSLIWTPISWILSLVGLGGHGHMQMMGQGEAAQEMHVAQSQVSAYMESYVQQYGDAALIFAAHDGYPQLVHGMLMSRDLGYRDLIDATDDNGNTALIYSAAKGLKQTTNVLLSAGADPDIANTRGGGRTALMEAAGSGHREVVNALRMSNATINLQDDLQNTALHYAAYHGHLQVVQELLKGDARRDIKNGYGHTPASYALSNGNKGISDLLNRAPTRKELERRAKKAEQDEGEEEEEDPLMKALGLSGKKGKAKAKPSAKDDEDEEEDDPLMKALGLSGKSGKAAKAKPKAKAGLKGDDDEDDEKDSGTNWLKMLQDNLKKSSDGKHVKGAAEDLHKNKAFAPETADRGISNEERKALEAQISALKKQHEEIELKAQKRIVELLEKSADQQKAVDDAEREARMHKMNATELHMKNQELHSRHQASEMQATEEKSRADRLHEELQDTRLEAERHKSRADGAERERDDHMEAARRHEDTIRRKQDEVEDYLQRMRRQSQEMEQLREDLRRRDQELREHRSRVLELESGRQHAGASVAAPTPRPPPATPAPTPEQAPPREEAATDATPKQDSQREAGGADTAAAEASGQEAAEAGGTDAGSSEKDEALAELEAAGRQEA